MKKMTMRVITEIDYTVTDDRISNTQMLSMGDAFETGWRFGAAKDFALLQDIMRKQFGLLLIISEPRISFERNLQDKS